MSDTSPEKDDPDVVRAYAILGLCATQFSALEFHIQFLLSFLHMGRELAVETVVFTRRSSFYQKVSLSAKPQKEAFSFVANALKLQMSECLLVDDTLPSGGISG